MTRRDLLQASLAPVLPSAAKTRPNIILVLADDMGLCDPSCYGNTAFRTPHIDSLAASGLQFENFYAASAVCTPSRAAILTGRFPLRYDIRSHFNDDECHLPSGQPTLPRLLRQAGYATAHVGKWHLGGLHVEHVRNRAASIPGPHQHGFDFYQCQIEQQPLRGQLGAEKMLYRKGGTCLLRNEVLVPPSDPLYSRHFTDINGDTAVRLVDEFHGSGRPFFLNLWFLDPHTPYEPAPEPFWSRAATPGISTDQRCFRSMVMHMDHKIGQLLSKLDQLKIRDNTLILFCSDNGGAYEANIGPYKGGKTDLHEGGLRVPGILNWPGRIGAGRVSQSFAHHCDILPTCLAAAGVDLPAGFAPDGANLLPHLTTNAPAPQRRAVHWQIDLYKTLQRHYPKPKPYATEATRMGKWKLLSDDGKPLALFDLEADPYEANDLLTSADRGVVEAMLREVRSFLTSPRDRSGFPSANLPQ